MKQDRKEQYVVWMQCGIILIFTVVCLLLCFNNNIWTDEAFTMQLLQQDIKGIIAGTAADVHPPLYYLIAKGFQYLFGPALLVQKAASIIPMVFTMMLGAVKVRKLFGNSVSLMFMLTLAVIPCVSEHAIQPRMYTWGLLFVTVCGVYAYDAYKRSGWQNWGIVLLSGVAAAYTHYFALISAAYIYGFLLLALLFQKRKEVKKWLVLALLTIVLYIPWLMIWIKQLETVVEIYKIPEITWKTIWGYVEFAFWTSTPYSTVMLLILFVMAALTLSAAIVKNKKSQDAFGLLCMMVPLLTMAAGVVLSYLIRPIYNDRYVFPAIGLLALGFAIGFGNYKKQVLICAASFLLLTGIVGCQDTYRQEFLATREPETTAFFKENLGSNDIIVYNFEKYRFIYEFYWPTDKLVYIDDVDFTREYDTIWYLDSPSYKELSVDTLEKNNWNKEFTGLYGIEHNEFELYKLTRSKG